jgi:hypothetical protein
MARVMRARAPGFLGSEFDAFLYAPIGADQNGGNLSVVSALARLDLDPWAEAASLAKLPVKIAIQQLSLSIAALQEIPSACRDPGKIAARLVALLPSAQKPKAPQTVSFVSPEARTNSKFYIFLCAFAVMLAIQFVMHSGQPPASHPASQITSSAPNSDTSAKVRAPSD